MPGIVVDGLDLFAVYEAAGEAIARARRGEGPTLIEAKTYRYYGHFQGDMVTYRTDEELNRLQGAGRHPVGPQLRGPARHGDCRRARRDRHPHSRAPRTGLEGRQGRAVAGAESELLTDVYVSY